MFSACKEIEVDNLIDQKGLNHLKSKVNQTVGYPQCYALSAEYSGVMDGPNMGCGTQYDILARNGNVYSAADIGCAYPWPLHGWKVIYHPEYQEFVVGAIINWQRGGKVGLRGASKTYGHTGVIKGMNDGRFQTYEQNAEKGEIVAEYDREFFDSDQIASICIPPDYDSEVIK